MIAEVQGAETIVGWSFIFGAALFYAVYINNLRVVWGRTRNWQRVAGVIEHVDIKGAVARQPSVNKLYQLDLQYRYSVDGREFEGTNISLCEPWWGFRWIPMLRAKRYRVGQLVDVFYDPASPSKSILNKRFPVAAGCLFVFPTLAAVVGVLLLTGVIREG